METWLLLATRATVMTIGDRNCPGLATRQSWELINYAKQLTLCEHSGWWCECILSLMFLQICFWCLYKVKFQTSFWDSASIFTCACAKTSIYRAHQYRCLCVRGVESELSKWSVNCGVTHHLCFSLCSMTPFLRSSSPCHGFSFLAMSWSQLFLICPTNVAILATLDLLDLAAFLLAVDFCFRRSA